MSAKEQYEKLKARVASMKEKGQEALGHVLQTVEVGGTAFAFGFMRGKMGDQNGDLDVVGVPASLGTGAAMHVLGFLGIFGKHSEHAHNIGDGALAEYGAVAGMRLGAEKSDFAGQRRIAGRRGVAGSLNGGGMNPFQQRNPFGNFVRAQPPGAQNFAR
jgi:hypothetical protein